jgi:carbonic anhydrase
MEFNGHAVEFAVSEPKNMEINANAYQLKGFHFHTPSEHAINGKKADLELHFVHKDPAGHVAVVGVLFQAGDAAANASANTEDFFNQFMPQLPTSKQDTAKRTLNEMRLNGGLDSLFTSGQIFRYMGSLTTPGCSENVTWTVIPQLLTVSQQNLKKLQELMGNNARPLQRTQAGGQSSDSRTLLAKGSLSAFMMALALSFVA